jgi:glycerol-3-phosphate acyltransferase PlsY
MIRVVALIAAAYLIGAFPTSYLVARLTRGVDLRQHGSGNLGATNAYRVLGWKAALPIFIVDIAKGWFPAAFFNAWDSQPSTNWALAYGSAAIIGHVYSVYVGLRGGKGVATSGGVLLAVAPLAMLSGFGLWTLVTLATGYVSLASILAAILVPIVVVLHQGPSPLLWLTTGLAAFVVWAHRSNIRRLIEGREPRFGRRAKEAG